MQLSLSNLDVIGIDCHIGSQLTETQPFVDALDRVIMMIDQLKELGYQSETHRHRWWFRRDL